MNNRMRGLGRLLRNTAISLVILEGALWLMGMPLLPLAIYAEVYNGVQNARGHWVSPAYRLRQSRAESMPPDAAVVKAVNDFGLRLVRETARERPGKNVFLSPFAVAGALTLTANGAAGATQQEMLRTLGFDATALVAANEAFHRANAMLDYSDPRVTISPALSLWLDAPATIRPDFLRIAKQDFNAETRTLDLQAPDAPARVNSWARDHTGGLLSAGIRSFGGNDTLAIVDALYFHGEWSTKFQKEDTGPAPFHRLDGQDVTVDMMHGKTGSGGFREPDVRAVRIPYGNGALSMYVFMPEVEGGLPVWLDRLTPMRWESLLGKCQGNAVSVAMPRFHLESEPPVMSALRRMGMARTFTSEADFSAMSPEHVWISRFSHKALLDVDEDGTTAAAMAVEVMKAKGRLPSIIVDRPFFLAIRDDRTGLILFEGAVFDPRAAPGT